MRLVLDSHTVLWYLENSGELSTKANAAIDNAVDEAEDIFVSAISLVEAIYLFERGRITRSAVVGFRAALKDRNSGLIIVGVDAPIADALEQIPRARVPDMPDRIIAATALHLEALLVTRDRKLQAAGIRTIW